MRRMLFLLSLLTCLLSACNVVITPPAPGSTTTTPETTTPRATETAATTEMPGVTETPAATETMTGSAAMTQTPTITATPALTGASTTTGTTASAQLQDTAGNRVGTATFAENSDGSVSLQVIISGFTAAVPGEHGIYIHQVGKCTPDFEAAGEHFNPTGKKHGLSNPAGPHAGDLPNMVIDSNGNASYSATDKNITLNPGPNSILDADGSALVIHADPDDQTTDPSGNSGGRIACGVITGGQP